MLAEPSFGLLGRSPDYIASFVTGMNLKPELFGQYADNVRNYYKFMRDNDIFAAHAIVSPQASRDPDFFQKKNLPNPACRVIARRGRRRRHLRHEDAGDRLRARRRNLDRQYPAAVAGGESGIDHLRGALQRQRRVAVVAQAVRASPRNRNSRRR